MVKTSPEKTKTKRGKQKRRKPCTYIGRKRVAVINSNSSKSEHVKIISCNNVNETPLITMQPVNIQFALQTEVEVVGIFNQNILQNTPKTPRNKEWEYESGLESLPMDLLVKILCHLHHDQLRAVFHVSCKLRKAVIMARQFHFNYTTPDRSRQEMLNTMTPLPNEHWPFAGKGSGKDVLIRSPHTPRAPKHGPRPPSRLKYTEMRQIAAVLFQESSLTPSKCLVPSVLPKPKCKSLASNRVLFYEDELCQAVAQNKLR